MAAWSLQIFSQLNFCTMSVSINLILPAVHCIEVPVFLLNAVCASFLVHVVENDPCLFNYAMFSWTRFCWI